MAKIKKKIKIIIMNKLKDKKISKGFSMLELLVVLAIIAIMIGVLLSNKVNKGAIEVQAATRTVVAQLRALQNDALNGKIVDGKPICKAEMAFDNTPGSIKYSTRYYECSTGSPVLIDGSEQPFIPVKSDFQTSGTISFSVPRGEVSLSLGGAKGVLLTSKTDPDQQMVVCVGDGGSITEEKGSDTTCSGATTPPVPPPPGDLCANGIQDPGEIGIDCEGTCPDACPVVPPPPGDLCANGIQDPGEDGIDCGGVCPNPCTVPDPCFNGILDPGEDGIDCGGVCPEACVDCSTILSSIDVYPTDLAGEFDWGPGGSNCVEPQCVKGLEPAYPSVSSLIADNSVNFSDYPARDACKNVDYRLPTRAELNCICKRNTRFGEYGVFTGSHYFSSQERNADTAYGVHFGGDFACFGVAFFSKVGSAGGYESNVRCVRDKCTPSCSGKNCGDDGCGGRCGTCTAPQTCSALGTCTTTCTPDCSGKNCGDNGCGGSCGTCTAPETCNAGICTDPSWLSGSCSGIDVYATDLGAKYEWKTTNTACVSPQCDATETYKWWTLNRLSFLNTVDFSLYPARNACKDVGGRLPTIAELSCIYTNRVHYGNNYEYSDHWSSTEKDAGWAWYVYFKDGNVLATGKENTFFVRCVRDK